MTTEYYDDLETRDPEARESAQFDQLRGQLAHVKANSAYYGELLADIDPAEVADRAALAKLPVTRKPDIAEAQAKTPPFGGIIAVPIEEVSNVFMSPGPVFEPAMDTKDYWGFARGLFAAGIRAGSIVHNTFSYHLTPAAAMMENGARAIGCPVLPGGIGNTEQQVEVVQRIKPTGYCGTPSFLRILLEKAAETGGASYTHASVGGEALPPSLREELQGYGIVVTQGFGTADLGLVAYESEAMEGMIINENLILEVCRPGTDDPVEEGEVGEIVVTNFNSVYPMIRYGTGDMTAVLPGQSPCGRTGKRIKGWMGRADQSTKVKGMFVHAKLVQAVAAQHAEIEKARLVVTSVDNVDQMTLKCEVSGGGDGLQAAIAETIRNVLKLRGEVEFVDSGSLPNDGIVVEDARTYE